MIKVTSRGSFKNTTAFLNRMKSREHLRALSKFGPKGVAALASATAKDSGETANAWTYEISQSSGGFSIRWRNSHVIDGNNIAILLQYGHGTGTGGYIEGRDYINPAMRPIFDQMVDEMWRVVTK